MKDAPPFQKKRTARSIAFRFLIAGGGASAVNWLVRFPLSLILPFVAAVAVAYMVGMVISFVLYRDWVFPNSQLSLPNQVICFVIVNLLGFTTVVVTSWMAEGVAVATGMPAMTGFDAMAHATAIGVGAVVNFFGHREVTFVRHRR